MKPGTKVRVYGSDWFDLKGRSISDQRPRVGFVVAGTWPENYGGRVKVVDRRGFTSLPYAKQCRKIKNNSCA